MGFIKGVHHIELITNHFGQIVEYFCQKLGYQFFATLKDGLIHRAALRNGKSIFVVRNADYYRNELFPYASFSDKDKMLIVDTVYDISLEVNDINQCIQQISSNGGQIITPPKIIIDYNGKLQLAVVKSCFGNVIHTLVDSSQYNGLFLPGFTSPDPILQCKNRNHLQETILDKGSSANFHAPFVDHNNHHHQHHSITPIVQYTDHVTFALHRNQTKEVMSWYQRAFGMKRCPVNSEESEEDGFVVRHGDSGMKLKAFDYWRCAKESVQIDDGTFKFVLAEPLSDHVPNQINTFLTQHHGPGIQHIGLHVDNIIDATREFRRRGAKFLTPPDAYYLESGKREEIVSLSLHVEALQEQGILIDTEPYTVKPHWHECKRKGYLLQVFSRPLFDRDTFFLELIERRGANGFGAGNIKALWRAVDAYMKKDCPCPNSASSSSAY